MHLKVSRNAKTLLSAHHRNHQHIKDAIQEAIQSGCIAPAAAAAVARHTSWITSSSLKLREHVHKRNPACRMRGFKAAFAKPNGLIFPSCMIAMAAEALMEATSLWLQRVEHNHMLGHWSCSAGQGCWHDACEERNGKEKCVCICVLITLVHPSVKFNLDPFPLY